VLQGWGCAGEGGAGRRCPHPACHPALPPSTHPPTPPHPTPPPYLTIPGFQKNPVSWYFFLVADAGMILSVALVTLPLYSLLAHAAVVDASVMRREARVAAAKAAGGVHE
jgi:hypothetical protein